MGKTCAWYDGGMAKPKGSTATGMSDDGAVERGSGRQASARHAAKRAGDRAAFDALAPPSERKLTESEICGARTQSGGTCRSRKGSRTDHPGYGNCAKHGGCTEAGTKSAMREMGRDFVVRYKGEVLRFGGNRMDPSIANLTPEQALLEEVRRSAAMVRFLEQRIALWSLSDDSHDAIEAFVTAKGGPKRADEPSLSQRVDAMIEHIDQAKLPALTEVHPRTGLTSFTDAREWLYLYREERGHLARVSKMCIDAGVAQRLVTIAEEQGRTLSSAIRAVLNALSLSPEQAALVPQIVPPILRAVATDSPIPDISTLAFLNSQDQAEEPTAS